MKGFLQGVVFGAVFILCCGCGNSETGASHSENSSGEQVGARWQYTDTAMGTVINQTLYSGEERTAQDCGDEIMALLARLEQEEISWRLDTSEVYRINASAGSGEFCPLSEDMAQLLKKCKELSKHADGAFDVTIGLVTRLWNIDKWAAGQQTDDFEIPARDALEQALSACGSDKLELLCQEADGEYSQWTGQEGTVYISIPEGMQLDLGAVGKGLALSEIQNLLEAQPDITGAVISVGGSILTYGEKPDHSTWKVGIVNPFDTSANVGTLSLEGQWCVSTSGDYERYAELDGVRYHHILDPNTGFPADTGVRGVTILAKDGFFSDALSTACFILGPEKGLELAGQYDAEVLFVMADGQIIMSDGMEGYVRFND